MVDDLCKPNEAPTVTNGLIVSGKDFLRRDRRGDFPPGTTLRVGGRVYFRRSRLLAFLEAGGGRPGQFAEQQAQHGPGAGGAVEISAGART